MTSTFTKTAIVVAMGTMLLAAQTTTTNTDTSSMSNHKGRHHDNMSTSMSNQGESAKEPSTESKTPKLAPQKTCPVMGGEINKSIYADYNGKRVYFCCGGCSAPFKKDPEKYLKKLETMGQAVDNVPVKGKMDHTGHESMEKENGQAKDHSKHH